MRDANPGSLLYGDAFVIYIHCRFKHIRTGNVPRHIETVDNQSCTLAYIGLPFSCFFYEYNRTGILHGGKLKISSCYSVCPAMKLIYIYLCRPLSGLGVILVFIGRLSVLPLICQSVIKSCLLCNMKTGQAKFMKSHRKYQST